MSFEIVYTSSQQGLHAGSRGFCTVAATIGIPRQLMERLESLSGYQHQHPTGSKLNPVNFCCQSVRIQEETFVVLSRVADAGADFSGRSNKIAHHLALSLDEVRLTNCSPTLLLSDPDFWFTKWARSPEWLPANRLPKPVSSGGIPVNAWKTAFGDAGWSAVVARSVENDFEPVFAIVPDGCNVIGMVHEALQHLSTRIQWRVSFSTYFTRSSGGDCHWRFLRDGMAEATAVRNRPVGIVIDVNSRLSGVDQKRSNQPSLNVDSIDESEDVSNEQPEGQEGFDRRPVTRSQMRRREAGARSRQARLAAKNPRERRSEREIPQDRHSPIPKAKKLKTWWIVTGLFVVIAVIAIVVGLIWLK